MALSISLLSNPIAIIFWIAASPSPPIASADGSLKLEGTEEPAGVGVSGTAAVEDPPAGWTGAEGVAGIEGWAGVDGALTGVAGTFELEADTLAGTALGYYNH